MTVETGADRAGQECKWVEIILVFHDPEAYSVQLWQE